MVSSEVQRTLVKSPPELWAEISDPASLGRHLGEFGEIRITRVEPEQRVEWEAGDTSGSVVIKPSGWGTKVKLTVNRELTQLDDAADTPSGVSTDDLADADAGATLAEPGREAADDLHVGAAARPEREELEIVQHEMAGFEDAESEMPGHEDAEREMTAPEDAKPEAELDVAEPDSQDEAAEPPAPEPRRGFFARLFGRRRAAQMGQPAPDAEAGAEAEARERELATPAHEPYNALAVWASQLQPGVPGDDAWESQDAVDVGDEPACAPAWPGDAAEAPVHAPGADLGESHQDASPDAQAPEDISVEITAAEEVAAEQVTAVLTGVLDRLGAAHHRPFSRS
ncbi:MAG: hypothetical protein QOI18_1360 [Solirubrobacteraceae bacterium]|nr:hypothetical protein [Solirubrobacteraceae bacterium]